MDPITLIFSVLGIIQAVAKMIRVAKGLDK